MENGNLEKNIVEELKLKMVIRTMETGDLEKNKVMEFKQIRTVTNMKDHGKMEKDTVI